MTRRYFFLTIVLRVTRKVTKTNFGELYRSQLHSRVTRSIFSTLLSLILIHSADACILVMACVDCVRARATKTLWSLLITIVNLGDLKTILLEINPTSKHAFLGQCWT